MFNESHRPGKSFGGSGGKVDGGRVPKTTLVHDEYYDVLHDPHRF